MTNSIEKILIHNRACDLAWERLASEEVFSSRPSEQALRLSDAIAKLQEETQPRARLAAQALDEFGKENIPSYANGRVPRDVLDRLDPPLRERYEQLKDYAGKSREELYRGFEVIDGMRQEIEKSRAYELMNDRVAMGNAIVAESRYECARLDYEMAEVFLQEGAERLSNFNDRKEVQPLLIEAPDGRLITHTFKDTEPRSILERIARPLIEAPAERELREAVRTSLEHQQRHLTDDLEKSRVYFEAAREIAGELSPGRNQGSLGNLPAPEFSPKEEMNIEIYAERLADERRREHYLGLLDPERNSALSRHDSHSNSDHSREAATLTPDAPALGACRGR